MAPHVDLSKKTPGDPRGSTRTFLLYLEGCGDGGETVLLEKEVSFPFFGVGGVQANVFFLVYLEGAFFGWVARGL